MHQYRLRLPPTIWPILGDQAGCRKKRSTRGYHKYLLLHPRTAVTTISTLTAKLSSFQVIGRLTVLLISLEMLQASFATRITDNSAGLSWTTGGWEPAPMGQRPPIMFYTEAGEVHVRRWKVLMSESELPQNSDRLMYMICETEVILGI